MIMIPFYPGLLYVSRLAVVVEDVRQSLSPTY